MKKTSPGSFCWLSGGYKAFYVVSYGYIPGAAAGLPLPGIGQDRGWREGVRDLCRGGDVPKPIARSILSKLSHPFPMSALFSYNPHLW